MKHRNAINFIVSAADSGKPFDSNAVARLVVDILCDDPAFRRSAELRAILTDCKRLRAAERTARKNPEADPTTDKRREIERQIAELQRALSTLSTEKAA